MVLRWRLLISPSHKREGIEKLRYEVGRSSPTRQSRRTELGVMHVGIQPVVALDLLAPVIHHLRLFRVVRPFRHSSANFLDDGFGATRVSSGRSWRRRENRPA